MRGAACRLCPHPAIFVFVFTGYFWSVHCFAFSARVFVCAQDSHHLQLENMFGDFLRDVGSEQAALPPQTAFGEAEELYDLTPTTKFFTDEVVRLYHANTGAWCIAEVLSDDWLSALAESLAPHFDGVIEKPYFDEVFTGHVEIVRVGCVGTMGLVLHLTRGLRVCFARRT